MKALITALAVLLPCVAQAQPRNCAPHQVVVDMLASGYGETRHILLLGRNGVVEVWVSPDTETWTITVTAPGGPTCLVFSGTGVDLVPDRLPPQGTPG